MKINGSKTDVCFKKHVQVSMHIAPPVLFRDPKLPGYERYITEQ